MNKKLLLSLVGIVLVVALSGFFFTEKNTALKVGIVTTPASALIQIAYEKGFFKDEGLNVDLEKFAAGKLALQAFLAHQIDFTFVGDVPLTLALMQGNNFYILTQVVENTSDNRVLVIKDGSKNATEYFLNKKRKLSTTIGATPEYYTYKFLKYYGIPWDKVEIVAQMPSAMIPAISTKSVDGISIFEPYPFLAKQKLAEQTEIYSIPDSIYSSLYVVAADKTWIDNNPQQAKAFLRALIKAENYIKTNPIASKNIVANITGFSFETIDGIWNDYNFKVIFTNNITNTLTEEAIWAIETGKVKNNFTPDFQSFMKKDLLDQVRSGG